MDHLFFCTARHWPDENAAYETAVSENPRNAPALSGGRAKRGVSVFSRLWRPGRELRVGFYGEVAAEVQQAVFDAACAWMPYANLRLMRVADVEQAHIRITMSTDPQDGNHSLIGTDALLEEGSTMTLSVWPDDPQFGFTVIHEFGHALGCEHEHQHPDADIPWDLPQVYATGAANGLDREEVEDRLLTRIERHGALLTAYDRASIMHYKISEKSTLGDWSVPQNTTLSEGDKAFMRLAYPTVID